MIIISKTSRWLFQQFALRLMVNTENGRSSTNDHSRKIRDVQSLLSSASNLSGYENYILINDPTADAKINDLFVSLFFGEPELRNLPFTDVETADKWSVLISYMWHKYFDSFWKITYATKAIAPTNDALPLALRETGPATDESLRRSMLVTLEDQDREQTIVKRERSRRDDPYGVRSESVNELIRERDSLKKELAKAKRKIVESARMNEERPLEIAKMRIDAEDSRYARDQNLAKLELMDSDIDELMGNYEEEQKNY